MKINCKVCGYSDDDLKKVRVGWENKGELCKRCANGASEKQEEKYWEKKNKAEAFYRAVDEGRPVQVSTSSKDLSFLEQVKVERGE